MDGDAPRDAIWLEQHAHVLFDTDEQGRITRLNEPDPETEAPLVFLARGHASSLVLFRADAPPHVCSAFATAVAELEPWSGRQSGDQALDPFRHAVRAWRGDARASHGPAFRFGEAWAANGPNETVVIDKANARLLEPNFPYTRSVLGDRAPVVAIVRDGVIVSACYSARRRGDAAEAGVDTIEPYRGQGLAVAVVAAWAEAARRAGLTPLYSTSWDNRASLRVAAKLGLEAYAETLSIG